MLAFVCLILSATFLIHAYRWESRAHPARVPSMGLVAACFIFFFYPFTATLFTVWPEHAEYFMEFYGFSLELYGYIALLGLLALVALYLGNAFTANFFSDESIIAVASLGRRFSSVSDNMIFISAVIFFAIGIGADIYKQLLGWVHYGGALSVAERSSAGNVALTIVSYFRNIGFQTLVFLFFFKGLRQTKLIVFYLVCAVALFNASTTGGALALVGVVTPFFLFYLYFNGDRRRLKTRNKKSFKRLLLLSLAGIFTLFIALGIKSAIRGLHRFHKEASFFGAIEDPAVFAQSLSEVSLSDIIGQLVVFGGTGANAMGVIISRIERGEQHYRMGQTLALVFVGLLPRFIYPDKPDIVLGMWFTDEFWRDWEDVRVVGEGTQGTAFMLPGDFYINFGIYGIVPGMLIVGMIIGLINKKILPKNRTDLVHFIFLCEFYWITVIFFFSFAGFVTNLIRSFLILVVQLYAFSILAKGLELFCPRSANSAKI